jgi:pimeloyl-ACP methyl ester carboxylesterase
METPGKDKFLHRDKVTLHYIDYGGEGPHQIVFLHGGGAHANWFDWVGPLLAGHYRVLAMDLRGHGDSRPTEPAVFYYDTYLDDLRALLKAEDIQKPILMAHSMGGILAVKHTGIRPNEVKALIICDALLSYTSEVVSRLQKIGSRPGKEYDSLDNYVSNFRFRPDGGFISREVHDYIARLSARQLPDRKWVHKVDRRTYSHREEIDTLPFWNRITCPTIFLTPENRTRITPKIRQVIQNACSHVEFKEVYECDHNFILEQPEQTAAIVMEFLKGHGIFH